MKAGHLAAMAFWGLGVVVAVASMVLLPGGGHRQGCCCATAFLGVPGYNHLGGAE